MHSVLGPCCPLVREPKSEGALLSLVPTLHPPVSFYHCLNSFLLEVPFLENVPGEVTAHPAPPRGHYLDLCTPMSTALMTWCRAKR